MSDGLVVDGLMLAGLAAMFLWDAVERWWRRHNHRQRRAGRLEAMRWRNDDGR
jgi:hypothetical protein